MSAAMAEKLSIEQIRGRLTPVFEKYGVDLFVDSGLRGLKFTGFLYDIERAAGVRTDVLDAADVTPRSAVERELARTGVVIYER